MPHYITITAKEAVCAACKKPLQAYLDCYPVQTSFFNPCNRHRNQPKATELKNWLTAANTNSILTLLAIIHHVSSNLERLPAGGQLTQDLEAILLHCFPKDKRNKVIKSVTAQIDACCTTGGATPGAYKAINRKAILNLLATSSANLLSTAEDLLDSFKEIQFKLTPTDTTGANSGIQMTTIKR
ncbi:MAG: hypothetical protein KAT71_03360 [Gammaproteobacteria bacterium]|nr:hypothetical protein [Gammaproteobacteria bacterium]